MSNASCVIFTFYFKTLAEKSAVRLARGAPGEFIILFLLLLLIVHSD